MPWPAELAAEVLERHLWYHVPIGRPRMCPVRLARRTMKIFRALFTMCPRTGRITGVRKPAQLPLFLFPLAGFLALLWFLIRVVPKPSRAAYPCQRVAAPLAGSFLVWVAGVTGATGAFRSARTGLREARYAMATVALALAIASIGWAVLSQAGWVGAALAPAAVAPVAYPPHSANAPVGTAKGFAPGRVVWAHSPKVTTWDGSSTAVGQRWFEEINQDEATSMMQWAVLGYAGKATTAQAWNAIFRHFNDGAPYQAGEKVFIKINLTTANAPGCADSNYDWNPSACGASWTSVGPSPQLMIALLDQLVNVVGVAQTDITIGDSTGLWVNELYNPLHNSFPDVNYLDARGTNGRTLSTREHDAGLLEHGRGGRDAPGLPAAGRRRRQVRNRLCDPEEPRACGNHADSEEPFRLVQRREQRRAETDHDRLLQLAPPAAARDCVRQRGRTAA